MQTKTRLGSRAQAMIAYHIACKHDLFNVSEEFDEINGREIKVDNLFDIVEFPGWSFAGIGGTRVCIKSPDDVVYKFDIYSYGTECENEYANYIRMTANLVNGWVGDMFRIAECEKYEFTYNGESVFSIAMEYVPGDYVTPEFADDIDYEMANQFDIRDTYSGNVKYDSYGDPVLIDFSR